MTCRVKICCISSAEEAKLAIQLGADAIGLVSKMPSGPGPIDEELITAIAKTIHPPIASFLLTSIQNATDIINQLKRVHTNTVQIVDELKDGTYLQIREALPYLRIVQVIHVCGKESIEQAMAVQEHVDALLLDSGNPKAPVKTLGGTGNTHNWAVSSELVKAVNIPVFLAGGLNAANVAEAIAQVKPFGVDVCSGVRIAGKLDAEKLQSFFKAVNAG